MDTEIAMLSRTIDTAAIGARIKSARLAARLTQRDLAGDHMSSAHVSRIEDGQRRPSVTALERFAELTHTTVEFLVVGESSPTYSEHRLTLDHAELALFAGRAQTALDAAVSVETSLANQAACGRIADDVHLLDLDARYVRAAALEALGELDEAIRLLEELTASPEPSGRWVKALIALCRCYKERGDLATAIETGERAVPLISELGLDGLTESIQLAVSVAGAYMKRGELERAIRICTQAISDADKVDSPVAKASAYWNASLVESRRGAHQSALALAQRALSAFELGEDLRNIGRLRTLVASLQLRTDPPDVAGALERLRLAQRELDWSAASPADKADRYLVLARARFLMHDHDGTVEAMSAAQQLIGDSAPLLTAELETLRGRVADDAHDADGARRHYRAAARALTAAGSDGDATQAWFELAGLLDQTGDRDGALDAYRYAAAATGYGPVAAAAGFR